MIEPIIYSIAGEFDGWKGVYRRILRLPVNFQNLVFFAQIQASKLTPGS